MPGEWPLSFQPDTECAALPGYLCADLDLLLHSALRAVEAAGDIPAQVAALASQMTYGFAGTLGELLGATGALAAAPARTAAA